MTNLSKEDYKNIAGTIKFRTDAFINGKMVKASDNGTFASYNPATGEKLADIASCTKEDVDWAVKAARIAFEDKRWSGLTPAERKKIVLRFSNLIMENQNELAVLESLDSGKPISDTMAIDTAETAECIAWYAEAVDKLEDQITATGADTVSMIVREPIGVVGAILPWNFPMMMAGWKLGPILTSGNSVVIKPAKLTTLTMLRMAELAQEAGIPDGVLNVVPGTGSVVGEAIAMHNDIDLITFTGSTEVGKKLLEHSGRSNIKRVLLELGGKNPCIIMPNISDLDAAAEGAAMAAFWNMGENCSANSRIIIHESVKDKFMDKFVQAAAKWTVGDPLDPQFKLGAIVEKSHMEQILKYIETGKKEGATLVCGGKQILQNSGGYFIEPTIFDHVTPDMTIAVDEIFGPVVAVMTFSDEDEAVRIANDTIYGLHASLWSDDINQVHRMTRRIKAGTISVNCFSEGDNTTPFGGFKQSGFVGRDKSLWAYRQYTEMKTIWIKTI